MSLTIRERCTAVAQCLQKESVKSIRAIAKVTGLSKSSVHRHKQAIASREQQPESSWWETPVGGAWLKLLVERSGLLLRHQTGHWGRESGGILEGDAIGASCRLFSNDLT